MATPIITDAVEAVIQANGGDHSSEHPDYPAADWLELVEQEETRLGYWAFVTTQIDPDAEICTGHIRSVAGSNGGFEEGYSPGYPVEEWIEDIQTGETRLGYWEDVVVKVTASLHFAQACHAMRKYESINSE